MYSSYTPFWYTKLQNKFTSCIGNLEIARTQMCNVYKGLSLTQQIELRLLACVVLQVLYLPAYEP